MKVLETRIYRGPNLYGYRPVIRHTVDLEELEEWPSDRIPGFVDGLVAHLPSLSTHTCSYGVAGGFVRRLREGTWFGHILEHCSLELQCLAGTPVTYGKCRGAGQPGVYHVIYSYDEERVGVRAGQIAMRMLRSLLPKDLPSALNEPFDFAGELEAPPRLAQDLALGPSTRSLVEECARRDIPWLRLNDASLVQFGHGKFQKRIQATVTSETRHIAVEIAQDKELTLRLLKDSGIPIPQSILCRTEDEAVEASRDVGYPCVVKPYNLSHGRGVFLDLMDEQAVRDSYKKVEEMTSYVLVESFLKGNDHRILVVNGEVVAVAERVPGHVVGDGKHTVKELVDLVNADPRRGVGHEKVLTRLEFDAQAEMMLKRAGKTPDSVLGDGERLFLRATGNLSTGGTAIDRTDRIHPENIETAKRAALVVGLDVAGIDFITPDISQPWRDVGGGIVEVNAAPGFRMHVAPTEGKPRNVAKAVVDMLFPPGMTGRIPIAAITGTNGKTTTTRMTAHILKMAGRRVGMTTTDGIYIDGERILKGDMTGPWSARVVLRDPTVDTAVLETARGGIVREGLGFRRCDVGCVMNVAGDHLGLGGINTIEDLAYVKRLVVEVVRDDGYSVLNADDPLVVEMAEKADGKIAWFTMHSDNPVVQKHILDGGVAGVVERAAKGDMLTLYKGEQTIPILWSHLIPATLEGRAKFNVQNALAASMIAHLMGASLDGIRQGLRTFDNTFFQAPGRCNVYNEHPFQVIVDYAHNPHAMRAMGELVKAMRRKHTIAVLSAPGDRRDEDIRQLGHEAASIFDKLILREDDNRRGRPRGQAAALLREGAQDAATKCELIDCLVEMDAVELGMRTAAPGDLLVLFADEISATWKKVIYWGKEGEAR